MVRIITCDIYINTANEDKAEDDLQLLLIKNGMMARVFDNTPIELEPSFKEQYKYQKKIYNIK